MSNTKEIVKQGVRCNTCGEEIYSMHRHDFVYCSCKSCYVDGGFDYLRFGGACSPVKKRMIVKVRTPEELAILKQQQLEAVMKALSEGRQ